MKREEKKQSIKIRIIEALFEGLKQKDLDLLTATEIAALAGVSKRTLYQYFASKKEMYLGLVEFCFKELAEQIQAGCDGLAQGDPYLIIENIGRCYLEYCLGDPVKCKIIVSYNEQDFIDEYPEHVANILQYSGRFELAQYIDRYFDYHRRKPDLSAASISLYLWAEVQGLVTLIRAKESWLESFYGLGTSQLISEHLQIGKIILIGVSHEKKE